MLTTSTTASAKTTDLDGIDSDAESTPQKKGKKVVRLNVFFLHYLVVFFV